METPNSVQNEWYFVSWDLEIWRMTLINEYAIVVVEVSFIYQRTQQ